MRQLKITQKITTRDSLALDKYLNEVGKIDLINSEQEAELARLIRDGDEAALHTITKANLRFVISVAKQYNNSADLMDLINEGNIGLIKATYTFDETRGFKFISFAVYHIRQKILLYLSENSVIKYPANKKAGISKYNAHDLYLAYHEGVGGYTRKTYKKKRWLMSVANKVQARSHRYKRQLSQCERSLNHKWFGIF